MKGLGGTQLLMSFMNDFSYLGTMSAGYTSKTSASMLATWTTAQPTVNNLNELDNSIIG